MYAAEQQWYSGLRNARTGACTAPSSQHAILAISVFALLSVTLGLLDTRPACDDKQPMDKSSRFTSETIAFATQLGDLHVHANAIGPRRSLPGAIYCHARNSCKRSCSSKTLHESEAVDRKLVLDKKGYKRGVVADKNVILPGNDSLKRWIARLQINARKAWTIFASDVIFAGAPSEVNIGEESSRFVSVGTPLAMHFRGLHRTPDVIDLSQIGIRNHLARRPRLRLVYVIRYQNLVWFIHLALLYLIDLFTGFIQEFKPKSYSLVKLRVHYVDFVDVRRSSGLNFKVLYSWCTSDPAESLALDLITSTPRTQLTMHEDVSIRQLLCKFFKNPFPCSDNCDDTSEKNE
ncbi:hypothetical protein G5I_08003 [Acromyrmex echinatior]|uniref:Uncharacterized protein n=1 Tax=Acromyrmex echinatior TaxID=103372 RepID=F4WQC8_ACREC|nr:hypothetical protein G5I_08003 [Acromyrmex echinatior]